MVAPRRYGRSRRRSDRGDVSCRKVPPGPATRYRRVEATSQYDHRHCPQARSKRNALREMQKTIQGSFPNEAFLIKAIFDHGSNFDEVHQNLARLNKLLRARINGRRCNCFRRPQVRLRSPLPRLTKQARDIMATVDLSKTTDLCLRFMTIEVRYGCLLPLFIADPALTTETGRNFEKSLRADCEKTNSVRYL